MMPDDAEWQIRQRLAQAAELKERLQRISGQWTSPDRTVTVRVGPTGVPVGLTINNDGLDLGGRRLAEVILEGFRKAGQQAGEQARKAVTDTVGDTIDIGALLPGQPNWGR